MSVIILDVDNSVLNHPYELLTGPVDNSSPVVAVDLEGTLSSGAAWRGMHGFLTSQGRAAEARRYYYRLLPEYIIRLLTRRGLREFKNCSILRLLQYFKGYDREQFARMAEWAVEHELWPKRREAVIDELNGHKRTGRRVFIVTGLFEPYVEVLLQKLPGFEAIGTPVIFKDGLLSGQLLLPFNVGRRKAEVLRPFMHDGKIHSAYGDSIDDSYMLAASAKPVAVHPDKPLRKRAETSAWRIMSD